MKTLLLWGALLAGAAVAAVAQLGGLPQAPEMAIRITGVAAQSTDETVTIENGTRRNQDLDGWTLAVQRPGAKAVARYAFPAGCVLPAGATVRVHAGPANVGRANAACAQNAFDLVWQGAFTLPNDAAVVTLRDAAGNVVDELAYPRAVVPPVFVNELEPNPASGNEWVEVFNAASAPVDVTGWTLETLVGTSAKLSIPLRGTIPARGFVLVSVPIAFLNDAGEVLELRDAKGNLVDATPAAGLPDALGDDRCWARTPDGADAWRFQACTRQAANV